MDYKNIKSYTEFEWTVKHVLDQWARRTHPDGVYGQVAWADVAELLKQECTKAYQQGLEDGKK
jgi:hypothetical protein